MAFTVVLDPDGYKRATEPGFMSQWTGADLWRKAYRGQEVAAIAQTSARQALWNPPGSDWLMMKPQQLTEQYFFPGIPGHEAAVFRQNNITYASGFTVREFDMSLKAGEGSQVNEDWWQTITRTPDTITGLDSCNYSAMDNTIGITLPSGMKTVAFMGTTPSLRSPALPLSDADYTPSLRWLSQPWPDTTFVFGFSNYAFVITNETLYALRSPNNDKQSWELVGQTKNGDGPSPGQPHEQRRGGQANMMAAPAIQGIPMMLTVVPVGTDSIYVYFGSAEPLRIKTRAVDTGFDEDRLFPGGTFWLGMGPKSKLTFQPQVVSYYGFGVALGYPSDHSGELLFDLGANYKPTGAYNHALQYRMQWHQGIGTVASGDAPDPEVITATGGQIIEWQLIDEISAGFVPDGTHQSGYFRTRLTPGHASGTQSPTDECFLAPQIRGYQLRFPPVLAARTNSAKTLTDLQVAQWSVESSLHDPDAKQIEIVLTPEAGGLLLGAGNWDSRDNYPVHIVVDGTVRVRGWVESPGLEEIYTEDPNSATRTTALRAYKITAKALLQRAECGWLWLPQIVNPEGEGYVEHTWIVSEVLNGVGFDTTDTSIYLAATDALAGTGAAQLPGTWGTTTGTTGQKDEGAFNPDYGQTKLRYLTELTRDFRGWLLYETIGGLIRYHPDPAMHFGTGGRRYHVAATIYRTQAEATAASRTGQYMLAQPTRTMVKPIANHVRISGQGDDAETFPHVIDSDPDTVTDINDPNFVGEYRPVAYPAKLAVDEGKTHQLARVALTLNKHRGRLWHVAVPLAPWEFNAGATDLALGDVVTLQGSTRSDCWVHHMEVFCQKRGQYITRLTVERLPAGNTSTAVGDCTGGTPWPGACLINP